MYSQVIKTDCVISSEVSSHKLSVFVCARVSAFLNLIDLSFVETVLVVM